MRDPTADLQFEHATYEDARTGISCGLCGKNVGAEYWQWNGNVACADCRQRLFALEAKANAPSTFVRALVLGFGTALAGGIGYAAVVAVTNVRFALITIGIAYIVATVIRKATGNVSGLRYQIMAVALTYMAGTMGYAPDLWKAVGSASEHGATATLVVTLGRVLLAAPFLEGSHSPIGLLIVGLGLFEAWRRAKPIPMEVRGPYAVPPTPSTAVPAT
jgi:hypothetical protein